MAHNRFWKVPKLYPGRTILCVGGGPSLRGVDLTPFRDDPEVATIAINSSAISAAPWADIYFFGDARWWRWHGGKVADDFPGRIITASCAKFRDGRLLRVDKEYTATLSEDPTKLSGLDSGYMAANLAYLLGARRIVLAGYDMGFAGGVSHHHDEDFPHEIPSVEANYINRFLPEYRKLASAIQARGVEIVRITPSRLDYIPQVSVTEALA